MSETVFKKVDQPLSDLLSGIDNGDIGLPDIQRPFVWKNAKVRNLFDSMYKGYPVGYFLFWESGSSGDTKTIGSNIKQKAPRLLIVDGQQRLTSLYAVFKAVPVIRENYDSELIEIAFNPLTEKFEVADAAIRRDKSYISNISILWEAGVNLFDVVESYLKGIDDETNPISDEDKSKIQNSIIKLSNLSGYSFTVLELAASVNEEQVSDVFVRINSEGKKLNQADFILTLMSVFWDEGRKQLEEFCYKSRKPTTGEASPFNYYIQPDPDQLLRVSVGIAFKRARLKYVYSILRGKDLETEEYSVSRREAQFELLKDAQNKVLNVQYWHDFLKAVKQAGFRSGKMISSESNLLFAYMLYLMGRTEYKVDEFKLRKLIARWFFMTALTGRFSSSPESKMEFDLARFRVVESAEDFVNVFERLCTETLSSDYWSITLPSDLATSSARSPSMFAYFASLNLLGANVLFSNQKISDLMEPSTQAKRASIERHHLFPKAYLKSIGVNDNREINQIANFTMVEWGDNTKISDLPPTEYLPLMQERFNSKEMQKMCEWHALPDGWETMEYGQFLKERRGLMSANISNAYELLSGNGGDTLLDNEISINDLVAQQENTGVEFKSTLRVNLHTNEKDSKMELAVLKTLAGFLNRSGGTLIIGVADDGSPVGIEIDGFPNEDKMYLHLINLIKDRIGPQYMMYMHPKFDDYEDVRVFSIECSPAKSAVFVKDGNTEKFFVRTGAATSELVGGQAQEYIKQRFN